MTNSATPNPDSELRSAIKDDLIEMAVGRIHSGSTKGRHTTGVYDIPMLTDYILEKLTARDRRLELLAQLETANYFKKYMISTSPFISEIIDPYIETIENRLTALGSTERREADNG